MTIEIREGMSLDEYVNSTENFEILNGKIVPILPKVAGHEEVSKAIFLSLFPYADSGLGKVRYKVAYVILDGDDWIRGSRQPDAMVILADTFERYRKNTPDWESKPYIFIPELVIEVVWRDDLYVSLCEKVDLFMTDGVQLVWIVNPISEKVHVYSQGSSTIQVLTVEDTLNGGDVLPELSIPLKQIFG